MADAKDLLLGAVHTALQAVDGASRVECFLRRRPLEGPVAVIALGKAACAMAQGAVHVLGERITSGLIVTKHPCTPPPARFTCLVGGHPIADASSLRAGQALLETLDGAPRDVQLLFLISGGASSLVEVLPPGVTLEALREVHRWLQRSGWGIEAVNAVRGRLSCLKGGRLASYLRGRPTWNLILSDVPGDDPAIVGSGPLVAADSPVLPGPLPDTVHRIVSAAQAPAPPPDDPMYRCVQTAVIATLGDAMGAAEAFIREHGYPVTLHAERLTGDVSEAATRIAQTLLSGPYGAHIWGGETTVTLPDHPGRGGRNQSLCLAVAARIQGDVPITFASIGTDGNDGATDDAGGVVDHGTIACGTALGLSAADSLRRADAGTYLAAVGALVHSGPTGTNVTDLMLGWRGEL